MTRTLKIGNAVEHHLYEDGTRGTIFKVDGHLLSAVLIELFLLRESLVERVVLVGEPGTTVSLTAKQGSATSTGSYGRASAELFLSLRDLELLNSFLLKYYRDGVAEVGHIDIGLFRPGSNIEEGTLVVQAAEAKPGMSSDEARRILGIS